MSEYKKTLFQKEAKRNLVWILVGSLIGGLSIGFYFVYLGVIEKHGLSDDSNVWGSFGSYVDGVVGAILAFVTVILIYKSLMIQITEFSSLSTLQRKQNTDSNFFNLLRIHNDILNNIQGTVIVDNLYDKNNLLTGKVFVEKFAHQLNIDKNTNGVNHAIENLMNKKDLFRNLIFYYNNVLRYIQTNYELDTRENYLEYLRTQISNSELIVLVYYLSNKNWVFHKDYLSYFLELEFFKYLDWEKELEASDTVTPTIIKELVCKDILKLYEKL